jgi:hypothetical protein
MTINTLGNDSTPPQATPAGEPSPAGSAGNESGRLATRLRNI